MTITRIFKVEIKTELQPEFENKFNSLSRSIVENTAGCIQLSVMKPSKWTPDEYAMISLWQDEAALVAFAGVNWNSSVIPSEMEKYGVTHSVSHFESWD